MGFVGPNIGLRRQQRSSGILHIVQNGMSIGFMAFVRTITAHFKICTDKIWAAADNDKTYILVLCVKSIAIYCGAS